MTKAHLEVVIANLKDRCKRSFEEQKCCVSPTNSLMPFRGAALDTFPIDSDQAVSLTALVSYVAKMTGRSEYRVERDLSNHFCIPNPKCLSQDQYEVAIRYMVDQVPPPLC